MAEPTRRKVLIITYYWPPSGGSGVQRWLKLVKYLRNYDWEPIIYTPENPEYPEIDNSFLKDIPGDLRILKTPIWEPYNFYKRFLGLDKKAKISAGFLSESKKNVFKENISIWLRGNLFIPDARKFWIGPSVRFLLRILEKEKVDAIVSTGPPHSMHLIGLRLSRATKIPWLADFCDPWTSIDFYHQLKLTNCADNKHHKLEKEVLSQADAVTPVTMTMAEEFNQIIARTYRLIPNGFDDEDILSSTTVSLDSKFSIAHIGSLVPSRNPSILWTTLAKMIKDDPILANDLEIKLVGKVDISALRSIEEAGLTNNLRIINYLPHNEAIKETQKSQVLLLLINQTPNEKGILTGKLFEYLAANRPILCLGPIDGDAARILEKTGIGMICSYHDSTSLYNNIQHLHKQFIDGKLMNDNKVVADEYSWKKIAGNVSIILDEISKKSNESTQ